ncbi:MAG: hypothetical protein R6U84_01915 [Candidatus Cloacimonadales bacterium]
MKNIDRIDINKKRPVPANIKLVILLAVVFGFWMRSCWIKQQAYTLRIYNIEATDMTSGSIDVKFEVRNPNDLEVTKSILIKAFTADEKLIASRITEIVALPKSTQTHLKMLNTLDIPIQDLSDIASVTVEIYTPSIF